MDDMTPHFRELGRAVAEVSDRTSDPSTLSNARRRFLSETAAEERRRPRRAPRLALASAVAALACVAALVLFLRREPAISFTVGTSGAPGAVGQWVAPEAGAPLDLRFSEGTVVTMAPGARVRVTDTSAAGAGLLIERGAVRASVTHRSAGTAWSVRAGPFEVRVTGTTFDARWDPATETFELTMHDGSVIVSGPRLPSSRPVVAGEQLVVSATRMELRAGAPAPPAACATPGAASPGGDEKTPAGAPSSSSAGDNPPAPSASTSAPRAEASWRALAAAGKHREAMEAAEAAGFSAEVARASSSELLTLSDTARFAGRPARAKEALLALRKRFGARGRSAFLLGKISADQLRSPGEAAMWFETYLQEEPGGPLAEQALGRLLELKKREPGAARLVAQRYLARYPTGSYAALARSLVEK